jgi:hypothetical protein
VISLMIYILILLIVLALVWWIIGQLPLPDPVKRIATVVLVVIFAIAMIYLLLPLAQGGGPHLNLR